MILIVSHPADEHAAAVLKQLERTLADTLLFDTSRYPQELELEASYRCGSAPKLFAELDGVRHDLSAVRSVWWRRPQPFVLDPAVRDSSDQGFAFGECHAALTGLWSCLGARWINDPERDEVAARKAYQLKVAAALGLTVPRTLITNSPQRARAFIEYEGAAGTIYKSFSASEHAWRETRLLRTEECEYLDAVRFAPVIFQEYIEADIDLRITVVGEQIFAAEILSSENTYCADFRMTMHEAVIQPHTLPEAVTTKLQSLMTGLGLVYGAIDMRLTQDGEYVFLEINPAGQWLFIEERTGQPITAAFAEKLLSFE